VDPPPVAQIRNRCFIWASLLSGPENKLAQIILSLWNSSKSWENQKNIKSAEIAWKTTIWHKKLPKSLRSHKTNGNYDFAWKIKKYTEIHKKLTQTQTSTQNIRATTKTHNKEDNDKKYPMGRASSSRFADFLKILLRKDCPQEHPWWSQKWAPKWTRWWGMGWCGGVGQGGVGSTPPRNFHLQGEGESPEGK